MQGIYGKATLKLPTAAQLFYKKMEAGVIVIRVLHHKQRPENYL